jgi:cell division protein FtsW
MRLARTDDSLLAEWWFTVDRALIAGVLVLIAAGLVLSLAASPSIAVKRGLPAFYFAQRHAVFSGLAALLVVLLSLLDPAAVRRLALGLFAVAAALMVAALLVGPEINGARRWLRVAGFSLQPSELAKPAFVVLVAWAFAESVRRPDMPARAITIALYALMALLLVLQPDIGQTLLVSLVWGALFFICGMPLAWGAGLAGLGLAGAGSAYLAFPHVRDRIDRFWNPASGDNYQIERALQAITQGGLLGRGPGEGTVKTVLPDAHTDFILAVIAEEYGALACLVLIGLYAFIAVKAFARALGAEDAFTRNAIAGLTLLFALQAAINMAVNAGLVPAKGMTLPFVSYGGSSAIAMGVTLGLIAALSRRRREPIGARPTGIDGSSHGRFHSRTWPMRARGS